MRYFTKKGRIVLVAERVANATFTASDWLFEFSKAGKPSVYGMSP